MANIVTSSYRTGSPEIDGRTWVFETHVDLVGIAHAVTYLAAQGANVAANLAAHATSLGADLQSAEIAANVASVEAVGSLASPTFVYSTAAQNIAALRAAYALATQTQVIMIGDFLNTLTVAQLENIFGMTAQQVAALQANKLQPAASLAASIRASAGQ